MDPDFEGISDIQDTEAIMSSRASTRLSPRNNLPLSNSITSINSIYHHSEPHDHDQPFYPSREYVENTLFGWGLRLGYLPETQDNRQTLKCLMELINWRHKELQAHQKYKESIFNLQYERNKLSSMLEQTRKQVDEKNKHLGRLENSYEDMKHKLRKVQQTCKKQREEDKKMIMMLKGKNEQIMHEMKKRQQEVNRVKQQMKKNVGEKTLPKAPNFEVYEVPKAKKYNETEDKVNILSERFQSEKKILLKENLLLKEKLYDIREEIVELAQWIDMNIFGQKTANYKNSFLVNHNLLFRKESLTEELKDIIDQAKDGMMQVMKIREPEKSISKEKIISPRNQDQSQKSIPQASPRNNLVESKKLQKKSVEKSDAFRENMPRTKKPSILEKQSKIRAKSRALQQSQSKTLTQSSKINPSNPSKSKQISAKDEKRCDEEESDFSVISHISMADIGEVKNGKFDKWDILFKE